MESWEKKGAEKECGESEWWITKESEKEGEREGEGAGAREGWQR